MWKKFIKHILSKFDIEVYRISKVSTLQNSHSEDPLEHNSLEWKERTITIEGIKNYLSPGRIDFYNKVLEFCVENGVVFDNADILDAGCSIGYQLETIGKRYLPRSLTGYEWSKKTIEIARKLSPSPNYVLFDILKDKNNKEFDVVLCIQVLEHLLDPEAALSNLLSMTKGGGFICITVPDGRKDTFYGHIFFWSPESFRLFIEKYAPTYSSKKYSFFNDRNVVLLQKNS